MSYKNMEQKITLTTSIVVFDGNLRIVIVKCFDNQAAWQAFKK